MAAWHNSRKQASHFHTFKLRPTTNSYCPSLIIGAYKVLSRVVQGTSQLLAPLDDVVAGNDPKDIIVWNDELLAAFQKAQKALITNKAITLPRPSDQLWIVTDGALRNMDSVPLYMWKGIVNQS